MNILTSPVTVPLWVALVLGVNGLVNTIGWIT